MSEKSLVELAYDVISASKNPVPFKTLWKNVIKEKGLSEDEAADRISQFFTNLLLDGRFVTFPGNVWDLKVRHTFDEVHQDLSNFYSDIESDEGGDEEETVELKEYNESFEQKVVSRDDELDLEENEDDSSSNESL